MTNQNDLIIIIPARGGSKRLPRKNILQLNGKPLIQWTIEAAIEANLNAPIFVSSDDDEILAVASLFEGDKVIPHKRPIELAQDDTSTASVLLDVIQSLERKNITPSTMVLLQPTSPLRNYQDITNAYLLYKGSESQDTVLSVCEVDHPKAWVGRLDEEFVLHDIDFSGKRSQDYNKEYRLNGAIYISNIPLFLQNKTVFTEKIKAYIMPKNRSVDIDDFFDFQLCQFMMNHCV